MPPMSFLSELMSSSSSSRDVTMASGSALTRSTATRVVGVSRHQSDENTQNSDASSEPEKESAKLVSIRELVAKNAAKDRPKLVVMDQSSMQNNSSDSRQNMVNELLSRKMGGGGGSASAATPVSGSVTASPSSSASSSSASTPRTASQRQLQVPTNGGSTALNALNELLQKRQPSQPQPQSQPPMTEVSTPSPKPTHRKRRAENPALQALLAQRNGTATPEPTKSSAAGESRSRAIAELLAKRVTPHPTSQNGADPENDSRKNALAAMLSRRGGAKEPEPSRHSNHTTAETERSDPKANALAEMLAKRNGNPGASTTKAPSPKKSTAVADMFAKRAQSQSPSQPAAGSQGESRSNALADMLKKRTADANTADKAAPNPLAEMLAKQQRASPAATSSPSSAAVNPLAAMLAKRQGGDAGAASTPAPTPKANPLAEMMAKRQAAATAASAAPTESAAPSEQKETEDEHANTPLKDHPKYASYFKMLKIGQAPDVVKHRMQRENVDPAILDCDPSKPLPKNPAKGDAKDTQDPEFLAALKQYNAKVPKYQQMLKMGLPRGAVEQKMRMEGIDVAWLEGPPQPKAKAVPSGPTAAEIAAHQEKYKQYFQMLKMGLPRGAVEHKMRMAGVDPIVLDGPVVAGAGPSASSNAPRGGLPPVPVVKKPTSIRKKIHWEVKRQESRDTTRESLWNLSIDEDSAGAPVKISKESKEMLEKFFVKEVTAKPSATAAAVGANGKKGAAPAKKQVMYLIDMKKSQNIAITLARIKLPFPELKSEILALNPTVLSTAQLQSLMDMWPDQQEQVAIDNFHGDDSLIGAAEKFLVEVRNIPRFREKLGCLVFKQEFPTRVHELRESINLVIRGVNQVCCSTALQQLFIYILQTGNLLNFGTDESEPASVGGFALNSLVKLSQTKAFTGGMTFLQYVVQSIERDIPQLARFPQQINLIQKCSKVSITSLFSEKRALEEGLKSLTHEAQAVVSSEGDADAELGASILKHFAAEVEREIDALQSLLDQLIESKGRFLEYFEEEETSEELDVLLSHIAIFSGEFAREHTKHLEVLDKKRLQDQQRLEQEMKKQKQEQRKLQASTKTSSHSLHEKPLHHPRSNQHGQKHGHGHSHGHKHAHGEKHRHTMGARPDEVKPAPMQQEEQPATIETPSAARPQRDYFPFVVDHLKKKPSFTEDGSAASLSRHNSGLGSRTSSSRTLVDSSSTTAA